MAWKDRDEFVNRDLMGVDNKELFADPLNVRDGRDGGGHGTVPHSQRGGGGGDGYGGRGATGGAYNGRLSDEPDAPQVEQTAEEEGWGISSFFYYIAAGGKQCCSMRDRTKPADVDAAKIASETGRPPRSQFADAAPHNYDLQDARNQPPEFSGSPPSGYDRDLSPSKYDYGNSGSGRGGSPPPLSIPPPAAAQMQPAATTDTSGTSGFGFFGSSAGRGAPADDIRPINPPEPQSASALSAGMSDTGVKKGWEWPPWCLNFKDHCIEVYVVDDETGKGKWVDGEPQSRVVDKAGRDAYLCVEYLWDGEYYVQDFGPQHVRKTGTKESVFELFDKDTSGRRSDSGAGMMSFMNS